MFSKGGGGPPGHPPGSAPVKRSLSSSVRRLDRSNGDLHSHIVDLLLGAALTATQGSGLTLPEVAMALYESLYR